LWFRHLSVVLFVVLCSVVFVRRLVRRYLISHVVAVFVWFILKNQRCRSEGIDRSF
jgi:hypothetical protein